MLKKHLLFCLLTSLSVNVIAQNVTDSTYRATPAIINNLVHTKLNVSFNYAKRYLFGKEWVTLHPHFYPTDSLTLDAKGMEIKELALVSNGKTAPLKYSYNGKLLQIKLDKTYTRDDRYTVYINYISKPDELKGATGSAAITASKGLYFINPDGTQKNKPVQVWTQGETDANSVWFPTIDKSNQKTTSEIAITVPGKYVTLSNGRLVSQLKHPDDTRTDTWKMELPHAPYLFMMAVGDFKIYKDTYNGKEVSYYLEPAFAPYAKQIFGNTPEMIRFYESILGVPYPWNKYSQIVCRDYVSGAMENTTATLHGDYVHRNTRDLVDADPEDFISHELFHQWFGVLVTCENWTNLTLNESFADYSEYLWFEHKYGKDRADEHGYSDMTDYYFAQVDGAIDANLVRYYYNSQEDVFDGITYQKGGRILNMLRKYVGDEAFFKSLNLYLKHNAFKSAEVANLRLAFEEVTGQDLNWFFNQWYFDKGYPVLDVTYKYDDDAKKVDVIIKQTQKGRLFKLPFAIDIYAGGSKLRRQVVLEQREQTFSFNYTQKPDLVNVDGDRQLLAKINDAKTLDQLIFGYHNAGNYRDRRDAIEASAAVQINDAEAQQLLLDALRDKYYGLQIFTIDLLKLDSGDFKTKAVPVLETIAKNDPKSTVRAAALKQLGRLKEKKYQSLFEAAVHSQSYEEAGAGLTALSAIDPDDAYQLAKKNENDANAGLEVSIANIYISKANEADIAFFKRQLDKQTTYNFNPTVLYCKMLRQLNNTELIIKCLDDIKQSAVGYNNAATSKAYEAIIKNFFIDGEKKKADAATDPALKAALDKRVDYANKVIDELENNAG